MIRIFTCLFLLVFFCYPIVNAQFKGLVVNEFSHGDGGSSEFIELVVMGSATCTESTADLRGWIVDDQNGWYGDGAALTAGHLRFSNDATWRNVPIGSIIVLFNAARAVSKTGAVKNPLVSDPTDQDKDKVYVLPIGNGNPRVDELIEIHPGQPAPFARDFAYADDGYVKVSAVPDAWNRVLALSDQGDAIVTVSPAARWYAYFSLTYGLMGGLRAPQVSLPLVGAYRNAFLTGANYLYQRGWKIGGAPADETPGKGNTLANQLWIDEMKTPPVSEPAVITGGNDVCINDTVKLFHIIRDGAWSTGDSTIAVVDNNGVVKGHAPGKVMITYTFNKECVTIKKTTVVTVNEAAPVVSGITGKNAVCFKGGTWLNNATPGGTWSSADESVVTVSPSGGVSAIAPGKTLITYTVSNGCGVASKSIDFTVDSFPRPVKVGGPDLLCLNSTARYMGSIPGGIWWVVDTAVASVDPSGLVTAKQIGTARLYYKATNTCGTDSGLMILRVDTPAIWNINPLWGTELCVGRSMSMLSPTHWYIGTWRSSNSGIVAVDRGSGMVKGIAPGKATVYYTVTGYCGDVVRSVDITVLADELRLESIKGPNTICVKGSIKLSNAIGGGSWSSSNANVANIRYNEGLSVVVDGLAPGTADIKYRVRTPCGLTDSVVFPVTVVGASALPEITGDPMLCVNMTTTLYNAVAGGVWSSSNSNIATVGAAGVVSGISAGEVVISYTVSGYCGNSVTSLPVSVHGLPPVAPIMGTTDVCLGKSLQLSSATAGGEWSSSNPMVAGIDVNGNVTGNALGTASIVYTVSKNDCSSSVRTAVRVHDFELRLTTKGPVKLGVPVDIQTGGNADYTVTRWLPAATFADQSAKQQRFVPVDPGIFDMAAEAVSSFGCADRAEIHLDVQPDNLDFFIPTAFSPNGDGKNDLFKVSGSSVKDITVTVYSQWGNVLYASDQLNAGWDGRYRGKDQPAGVYVFAVRAVLADGTVIKRSGSVNLIR